MMSRQFSARDWDSHPPFVSPAYKSTVKRGPAKPLIPVPETLSDLTGPAFGHDAIGALDNDLTKNAAKNGAPLGERIIVTGRVLEEGGRPVPNVLIEIWQANAAGRYLHEKDRHDAPLDPNFFGAGRTITDADGRYRFLTVRPGAYPWRNHANAWRPQHIHFSVFGPSFASRLVTQMYFPGDPLIPLDPIHGGIPGDAGERLIAAFDLDVTEPELALGYSFDIVLRGRGATPIEN